MELWDTKSEAERRLTPENLDEVAYATTRMLHAWPRPATIEGRPYVDASYTCLCPALELVKLGYRKVMVIGTEPGPLSTDMFSKAALLTDFPGDALQIIQPEGDLRDFGVDFTSATSDGLAAAFHHGQCRFAAIQALVRR